MATCV